MYCEKLHFDYLFLKEYVICPFCFVKMQEINNKNNQKTHCCGQEISEIVYQMICTVCGIIHGEIYKNNYIDFYENMYKIRKKSVYIRKYHIQNVLTDIALKTH